MTDILSALQAQIRLLAEKSRFRNEIYASVCLNSFHDFEKLPFTNSVDIINRYKDMLCISPRDVSRVVSLSTSGTTGLKKHLFFSAGDLERTIRFFSDGMSIMCRRGDNAVVLMPTSSEMGLTSLLCEGLSRIGVRASVIEPCEYSFTASAVRNACPDVIIAAPVYLRRLALSAPDIKPRCVLLSSDYCANSVRDTIARIWSCDVYAHYGLTETGLGCAVECSAHNAMHIRSDELYLEIINPDNGSVLPNGVCGEIVISTLRREAMPLIRYRTGDLGILETCSCGFSPALSGVYGRVADSSMNPSICELDDLLFACDSILDYNAQIGPHGLFLTVEGNVRDAQKLCASIPIRAGSVPPPRGREKRSIIQKST